MKRRPLLRLCIEIVRLDDGTAAGDPLARVRAFVASLKEQGLHVGIGLGDEEISCVTCGIIWPCEHSGVVVVK